MKVKLINAAHGRLVINIESNPTAFRKVWEEVCQEAITSSAAKYCNDPRRVNGITVIDAPADLNDAVECVYSALVRYQH